jgi:hypothetical protein
MDGVTNDFYEDDEPVSEIVGAFESSPKGVTAPHLPPGAVLAAPAATFGLRSDGYVPVATLGVHLSFVGSGVPVH